MMHTIPASPMPGDVAPSNSSSSIQPPINNNNNNSNVSYLQIGNQVDIASRTYPGINKPGGHATITFIHYNATGAPNKIDVRYVLGGREKDVELTYVSEHVELERTGRERRSRGADGGGDRGRRGGSLSKDEDEVVKQAPVSKQSLSEAKKEKGDAATSNKENAENHGSTTGSKKSGAAKKKGASGGKKNTTERNKNSSNQGSGTKRKRAALAPIANDGNTTGEAKKQKKTNATRRKVVENVEFAVQGGGSSGDGNSDENWILIQVTCYFLWIGFRKFILCSFQCQS